MDSNNNQYLKQEHDVLIKIPGCFDSNPLNVWALGRKVLKTTALPGHHLALPAPLVYCALCPLNTGLESD